MIPVSIKSNMQELLELWSAHFHFSLIRLDLYEIQINDKTEFPISLLNSEPVKKINSVNDILTKIKGEKFELIINNES